jgi:hypothetical protein
MLIVAGGPGTHSVYVPCFGNSRAVTREIVSWHSSAAQGGEARAEGERRRPIEQRKGG